MTDVKDIGDDAIAGSVAEVADEAAAETISLYNGPRLAAPYNPLPPDGARYMKQAEVTPAMTAWASEVLNNPGRYPMHVTATRSFGGVVVMARVEHHTYQGKTGKRGMFRGVSLLKRGG